MAAAGPIMSLTGGAIGAEGALLKGQMTANSLNAQADQERIQAEEAKQAGAYNVFRQQMQATQSLGRATAAYGASGVASGSTSEQSVLMAGAMNSELDRQNILHGANMKAVQYENQASLNKFGANSALEGSYFSAIGSVLGGGQTQLANRATSGGGSSGSSTSLTPAEAPATTSDTGSAAYYGAGP